MSTVKATNFQHPSSAAANITLGSDGSVVLPAGFSGGLGTNVVQTVKTDTYTYSGTSFADVTGLSVTITPTSDTAKILVIAQIAVGSRSDGYFGHYKLVGGNTSGYVGDAAGSRIPAVFGGLTGGRGLRGWSIVYLDSPASTSAQTYKIQARDSIASGTVYVNRDGVDTDSTAYARGASSITAIEVAA